MSDDDTSKTSQTDWELLEHMPDNEIDTSDQPELTDAFFARARVVLPRTLVETMVSLDPDILAWFKAHRAPARPTINAILRSYIAAQGEELLPAAP
jgi:uncharacterized protein (DUF4415 family)